MSLTTFVNLMSVSSPSNGMGKWWNKTVEWIEWWKSKKSESEESESEESESEESESEESESEESESEEEVTTTNSIPKPLPVVLEALTTSTLLTTSSTLLTTSSTLLTTSSTLLTTSSTTKIPEITQTVSSIFQSIKTILTESTNETMVNEAQATLDNVESEKSNLVYIVPSIIGSVSLIAFSLFLIFRKDKGKVSVEEIPVSTTEDLYLQPTPTLERDEHLYETPLDEFTSEDHLYEFSHPSDYRKKVEGMKEETGLYDLATLEQPVYNLASGEQELYDLASNN